jgi:hypothetical protein
MNLKEQSYEIKDKINDLLGINNLDIPVCNNNNSFNSVKNNEKRNKLKISIFSKIKKKIINNNDILYEMRNVIEIYMGKLKIDDFKSRILASDEKSKELIKLWISPNERLSAKLLYSFNIQYKKNRFLEEQYEYEFDSTVEDFHRKCDNKKNILIICKSQNEVFGGYTPLCFTSEDEYGKDNESFLFS